MKHASLNHVYRLVWSEVTSAWVAVAEHRNARGKGRRAAAALVASTLLGAATTAHADGVLPTSGRVAAGAAAISQNGATMTVAQQTDRVVIDWNTFDIGAQNGVRFAQPGSGSIALNRVTGGGASSILGNLTANGQVWLVNPGGIVFGSGARVDVGGLVASSLALSNSDFLAGRNHFTDGTGAGAVVNQGRISATGGVVALLAPRVRNDGTIATRGGSTVLAAGDRVSLDFNGDGLVSVAIDRPVVDALVDNSGRISADGGLVVLSARSANKALDSVIDHTGVIEAKGLVERNGRILLDGGADLGTTHVAGTLDATSVSGVGGAITVTGHDIVLDHGATLDASGASGGGSIRVGGGFQGKDTTVANATNVAADATVTARADATGNGNGGNVVFWSDLATRFAGDLSVRGGPRGGDGGSIEVSGKQDLGYSGRADARAPLGRTGDLLLDPAIVTVSGGGTGTGAVTGTTVYEKDLEAQNANVLLQATGNVNFNNLTLNGGDGKISMANNVSLRVEAGTGLTASASGDVTFAAATNTIEVFGTGSLLFMAGSLGTGYITNAPNLIAHGAGTNPSTLPTHTVTTIGSGTPGAGSVTLFGADGVTIGGSVTTNGGYVRVWADSDNASGGGYTMSAPVVTSGGNFYVSAGTGAVLLNSDMTLGTGRILFQADGGFTNGARTLGGVLSASGAVNVSTPFTMNAGAGILTDGVITFSNTVNLNTGAGALTLRASAIDFTAATLSNLSTASLILQPASPATSMVLGDANGFASATTLAKLPGVKNLTIGRTDGTGTTSVASNFTFNATGMLEIVNRNIAISGGTLTNTGGNVTLTGDNVDISRQVTSKGGTGSVTIRQLTAANPITLGSNLPNSAIGQVNAATLVVGRADGGDVTFATDITTNASSVHLLSGGQVIGTAGGVSAAKIAINAGGGATITAPAFNFSTLALAVGGPTTVTQTRGAFTLGTVDGVNGLAVNTGTNAAVTLSSPGAITAAPSSALSLNTNTSLLTFNATAVDLSASTVTGATNASFALRPLNASDNLVVGGTSGFATTATLAKLTNVRNVTVGRSDGTGLSTVSASFQLAASGTLELVNGQVVLVGPVRNTSGGLKLTALAGNLTLGANATAGTQLTLSATGASVAGAGVLAATSLLIDAPAATVALNASTNSIGTIAGNVGSLSFVDATSLVVGTVGGVNGVTSAGNLLLRTTSDLTLNQGVSGVGTGDAVVLAAGGNFIDNAGASAIGVTGGGRWLVYSGSPQNDTRGGLSYAFKQYDASYGATVLGSGNGFVYRIAPTVTIGLTGTTAKVYDAGTAATLTAGNFTTSGTIDGDSVTFARTGASFGTKDAGVGKSVSATGLSLTGQSNGAATVYGYQFAGTTATGNIGQITPATLTVGATTVADKVYNGNALATVTHVATSGVLGSDAVGTTATGTFGDKNVGNMKAVTVSGITLTGAGAANYVLDTTTAIGSASITPATLIVGATTVADKVYNGNTVATVTNVATSGVLGSDVVGATATGSFADKNVGNAKAVAVSGITLTGAEAANYVLDTTAAIGSASITPATLTVGTATIANKVYDATTGATVGQIALNGVFGSDAIATTATGAFADKNVANGKAVAVSGISLSGIDAGNYVLNRTNASGVASITPAALSVGNATIANKVYDATTAATVGAIALGGVLAGDTLGTTSTGTFADRNVGDGKAVTVGGISLTGTDAGNYALNRTSASGVARITPAMLNVTGATVASKVYDANTGATVDGIALSGVIGNDAVGGTATGTFADRNVGSGKAVTVGGIALSGTDSVNYVLNTTTASGIANITPATLNVAGAMIANKVYDATTGAIVADVALRGVLGNDAIGATATGAFADRNVGNGKSVAVDGIALTGADAGNYVLNTIGTSGTASITPSMLDVGAATVANKVYDATTVATVSAIALNGVFGGDSIGATANGTFTDRNVGNGKAVTVGGISLTGADAGNYALNTTGAVGIASITPAMLNVANATIANKVYDATTGAVVDNVALSGVLGRDAIGATASGAFADRNVGNGKAVAVSEIVLNGTDATNYVLATTSANGTANITPAALTVGSTTVASKTYDASTIATVDGVALNGVIAGDAVGSTATGAFADRNTGFGKAVTVDVVLTGADADNYALATRSARGAADIGRATLGVTGAAVADKLYDGTTTATVGAVALSGVLAGDRVAANASGSFVDPEVGTGKLVTVNGIALDGADAGNYRLASSTTTGRATIAAGVGPIQSGTLAALVSPLSSALVNTQAGASSTADGTGSTLAARSDATRPSDVGLTPRAADPIVDIGVARPTTSTSAGEPSSVSARAIETASVTGASTSATATVNAPRTVGTDRIAVATVSVPDTVLTVGSKVSILLGGSDVEKPVAASLPVYSVAPGTKIQSEGQFFVNDSGASLSLAPAGDERSVTPSLTQVVSRSAEAMVPLSATESVTMRVELLADRTLVAVVSAPASSDATEMLAAYGLVIARTALSTPVDDVRAVVLQFTAAATGPDDVAIRQPRASADVR